MLDHESFAVVCPLALIGVAFYPVSVRRPAAYALRFLPTGEVTLPQLRFASVAMVSFWEDLHLQGICHAGRTNQRRRFPGAFAW